MGSDRTPDPTAAATNARIDQLAALLRDVFDRLQINVHDPDVSRAIDTTCTYLYGVLLACADQQVQRVTMVAELVTHHAAFQRLLEGTR
jgi:hypothetical protein